MKKIKPKHARLLDVGCAHGWFLDAAAGSFESLGIEPDEAIHAAGAARGLPIRLGYFPDVLRDEEKFDIIVFNDVFEHIPDSGQVLQACYSRLADDGILVLNLPSSKGLFYRLSKVFRRLGFDSFFERLWQKDMPSPHLHYFNSHNLGHLVRQHKFSIEAKGTLPVVRLQGLFTRISFSGNMGFVTKGVLCTCIAMALPVLRILPSDIIYVIAKKKQ
ncbi:class I SAM-dependent methyltransferase [Achromobacter aegrifaciens]